MIQPRNAAMLICVLLSPLGLPLAEAQVGEHSLGEPDAMFPQAFSLIQGVRELEDGRVLIADPLEQVLAILDFDAGTSETLGGVGAGPGEYRQPDGLYAISGGATLLVDLGNARLTVVEPDFSFGETIPITQGEPGHGGRLLMILPQGVDEQGRIYFQPFGGRPGGDLPDSAAVMRYDRSTGSADTVAMVKLPEMTRSTSGSGGMAVRISLVPLSPRDAWAVAPDGRVAVARASDYHVEWIEPDGRVVRGVPMEYSPVKIRRADKEEWVERIGGSGLQIGMTINNGERQVSFSRGGGSSSLPDIDGYDWPDTKPAFVANGLWVTPEDDMWVQRSVAAGEPPLIDVFGADSNLKTRIRLPAGRRIVGFGRGTLYLIQTDEFGLQSLERYLRSET